MGIENTAGAHPPFGIMKLQARRELRAIFVWKTMPREPTPANFSQCEFAAAGVGMIRAPIPV